MKMTLRIIKISFENHYLITVLAAGGGEYGFNLPFFSINGIYDKPGIAVSFKFCRSEEVFCAAAQIHE
jgi:hypothetical protein